MKTFRLYTGKDGQSHIEPVDLARTPSWTKGLATTQISFRESPVGNFIDWHPAPRRQFVDHPVRASSRSAWATAPSRSSAPATRGWWRTPPARATPRGWSAT